MLAHYLYAIVSVFWLFVGGEWVGGGGGGGE